MAGSEGSLIQGLGQGAFLHGDLRVFPAVLAKGIVGVDVVEILSQGALTLFLAHGAAGGEDGDGLIRNNGLLPEFSCHRERLFS